MITDDDTARGTSQEDGVPNPFMEGPNGPGRSWVDENAGATDEFCLPNSNLITDFEFVLSSDSEYSMTAARNAAS